MWTRTMRSHGGYLQCVSIETRRRGRERIVTLYKTMFFLLTVMLITPGFLFMYKNRGAQEKSHVDATEEALVELIHVYKPDHSSIPWHVHIISPQAGTRETVAFSSRDLLDLIKAEMSEQQVPRWYVIATPTPRAAAGVLSRLGADIAHLPHRASFLDCGLVMSLNPQLAGIVARIARAQSGHLRLDRYPLAVIK